ncbi:MAG TPA: competence/damage-inducible protein A [Syntrophomonadaceae bacterium]|nr:competence/damage-inducible protein A [Syntrophomonadaceae bacterium]
MKKAFIISTGTELILGDTLDINASFISQQLELIGIRVLGVSTVGDNERHIKSAFELALKSADIIIASGGLGPTRDDLTKEVVCKTLGLNMKLNELEADKIRSYFASRGREMPESNLKQAMFPDNATILRNLLGTAPGIFLKQDDKTIILLPGPPQEMKKMLIEQVIPLLRSDSNFLGKLSVIKTVKVFGLGESQVEKRLSSIIDNLHGCSVALIAKEGEILIRVTAEGQDLEASKTILNEIIDKIEKELGKHVYGFDDDELKSIVAKQLTENNYKIAVAESCTGGLVSKYLTDMPGSSEYLWGSIISYSNMAKIQLLDVSKETLKRFGAVSKETAEEMAKGILKVSGTNLGLAITGIAGPDGGSPEKPVGLVYIALAYDKGIIVEELHSVGNRTGIRVIAAKSSLDLVRRFIKFGYS